MTLKRAQAAFSEVRPEIAEQFRIATDLSDSVGPGRRMSPQENQLRYIVVALIGLIQAYVSELLEERADDLAQTWDALSEIERRYVAVQARRHLDGFLEGCTEEELAAPRKIESLRNAI